jgi:uncharacterized protein DUF1638
MPTPLQAPTPAKTKAATKPPRTLLIACGALARELVALIEANRWEHVQVTCLPAIWHNTPQKIPDGVRAKIRSHRRKVDRMIVIYGDCGTGGRLDAVLEEEGVERIEGPHCYEFFYGATDFKELMERDPTCFFLTDYLVRHFDRLMIQGLGIDKHPELLELYFGNYTKLVYLAQTDDARLREKAEAAAARLGLAYEHRATGYGDLGRFLERRA